MFNIKICLTHLIVNETIGTFIREFRNAKCVKWFLLSTQNGENIHLIILEFVIWKTKGKELKEKNKEKNWLCGT